MFELVNQKEFALMFVSVFELGNPKEFALVFVSVSQSVMLFGLGSHPRSRLGFG